MIGTIFAILIFIVAIFHIGFQCGCIAEIKKFKKDLDDLKKDLKK
jgi:hypothetical protein